VINRTLEDLRSPDERTLLFTPLGLGLSHQLSPEAAVAFHHDLLSGTDLVDEAPAGTRLTFEGLRTMFVYGVLQYELFTTAWQFAHLVIELALRDRFLSFYPQGIVLVHKKSGDEFILQATSFDDVHAALRKRGGSWQIRLARTDTPLRFDGMLTDLWNWAREEGLLPGQRARIVQRLQKRLRNSVAHPSGYQLGTPGAAAMVLRDLAEIINCLWGSRTPGGRLHPAPKRREVLMIAWDSAGRVETGSAQEVPTGYTGPDSKCILVRAVADRSEDLSQFDARFECTRYPVDLLWGPGPAEEARAWFESNMPDGDEVDTLDQYFVLRHRDDGVDPPRRVVVAAGLVEDERAGTWVLVKADHPQDALGHVRNRAAGVITCVEEGECGSCAADTIFVGTWAAVLEHAAHVGLDVRPSTTVDVQLPSLFSP